MFSAQSMPDQQLAATMVVILERNIGSNQHARGSRNADASGRCHRSPNNPQLGKIAWPLTHVALQERFDELREISFA
jgi:hypothetical protein